MDEMVNGIIYVVIIFLVPIFLILILYFLLNWFRNKIFPEKTLKFFEKTLSKIAKENPNISSEELLKRVKFEYELEKQKHPELGQMELLDFKTSPIIKREAKVRVIKKPINIKSALLWRLMKNLFK